jgi:hypothetical protein
VVAVVQADAENFAWSIDGGEKFDW